MLLLLEFVEKGEATGGAKLVAFTTSLMTSAIPLDLRSATC